jgi:hypothetical protein
MAERFALEPPALTLMLLRLVATVAVAVMVEPLSPKLTLFEFEKTVAPGTVYEPVMVESLSQRQGHWSLRT